MLNSSTARACVVVALGLLGISLVAQNDDGLALIRTAPRLNLERTEFMFAPRLPATSPTVGRAVSCVAVDRRGYVYAIQRGVPRQRVEAGANRHQAPVCRAASRIVAEEIQRPGLKGLDAAVQHLPALATE